jgi:hypothetical protein
VPRDDLDPVLCRLTDLAFEFGLAEDDITELVQHLRLRVGSGPRFSLPNDEYSRARRWLLSQRDVWCRRFRARHPVVVDASNVAHAYKDRAGRPRLRNITLVRKALEGHKFVAGPTRVLHGASVWIVADASLEHVIDDSDGYMIEVRSGHIQVAPKGVDADRLFLPRAEECRAYVVSKDVFRDYEEECPRTVRRRIDFTLRNNVAQLHVPSFESRVRSP